MLRVTSRIGLRRWENAFFTTPQLWSRTVYKKPINHTITQRSLATKKGKVSVVSLDDLDQGLLLPTDAGLPAFEDDVLTTYPTLLQGVKNNMQRLPNCIVITKVGGFYELYFEHAAEYGSLLGLKISSRKTSAGPVAMAGFPFSHLDKYLRVLVQEHGKHVAICDETPRDQGEGAKSGPLYTRNVSRIITPGTLIDEHFLSPYEHNYLLALCPAYDVSKADDTEGEAKARIKDRSIGIAWLDLSSGDFFTQIIRQRVLPSALARIGAREILLEDEDVNGATAELRSILQNDCHNVTMIAVDETQLGFEHWVDMFDEPLQSPLAETFNPEEVLAMAMVVQYTQAKLPNLNLRLRAPVRRRADEHMSIDKHTLRGLEILHTLRDGLTKGSLLHAIRRTSTEGGARLLEDRLTSPSLSLDVIAERLDLVEAFMNDEILLQDTVSLLKQTTDTQRLVQRFALGRGNADDLLSLANTINTTKQVGEVLQSSTSKHLSHIQQLHNRFNWDGPDHVAAQIINAIDQEGLRLQHRNEQAEVAEAAGLARSAIAEADAEEEMGRLAKRLNQKQYNKAVEPIDDVGDEADVWIMRRDASERIQYLHQRLEMHYKERQELSISLRKYFGTQSLSLRFAPGLGYHCHLRNKDAKLNLAEVKDVRVVNTTKSTKSFEYPPWKTLGSSIDQTKLDIRNEEQQVLRSLRDQVIKHIVFLRRNACILDEIDLACSFARLAIEHNLKRPVLNLSNNSAIFSARHMMVEESLVDSGGKFTPNDCMLNEQTRVWLITGPNMAGKSTFLRQTALISILAQTGSFVPAEHVELGLVDQLFSRVGSADNVSQEQSTFMVEMLETAHILQHATSRSFVIMDEVGRGTTTEDGVAIGYAVLQHLHTHIKCRTLFATHFHTLADMTKDFPALACYCTDVVEESNGTFWYDHKMRRGVNRNSHALKVARSAGMPEEVIDVAKIVLEKLKTGGIT